MKTTLKYLLLVLTLIVITECIFRLYMRVAYGQWKVDQIDMYTAVYPMLEKLENYQYDEDKHNMLILGGSVVYADTIPFYQDDSLHMVSFCGFRGLDTTRYNVLNLAYPAHTSLDSRFKFDLLSSYTFDYVLIYHGINDTRSNNVDESNYDPQYRHIQFYDELALIKKHDELKSYVSLYMLDLISLRVGHFLGLKAYTPKEFLQFLYGVDEQIKSQYFGRECQFFTEQSFRQNIEYIINQSSARGSETVLLTYAYYQPANYTYEDFKSSGLDYATNFFPTELYGDPDCVPAMIAKHNEQIRVLGEQYASQVKYQDFNASLEKGKHHFMDICHLTSAGCAEMEQVLDAIVRQ